MRSNLKTKVGVRKIFTGIFERYGFAKVEPRGIISTAVILDVKAKGVLVADHVWVEVTNEFREVGTLSKGEKIMFSARVLPYKKNHDTQHDLGLEHVTKVRRCVQ